MQLALFQPDIPQNLGSMLRLAAGLGVGLHIIEPCGFPLDDRRIRRVGMDYGAQADVTRHVSWERFYAQKQGRLILLTTKGDTPYTDFAFQPDDVLLLGRESAGVPEDVHQKTDAGVYVPMTAGARSLNVVQAAAMVLGEGLRQTGGFAT